MTEAHFTTGINRSAFNWVQDKLGGDHSGSAFEDVVLPTTGDLGAVLPELIIRSKTDTFAREALPELFMRLCEAEIHRRINGLKARLDDREEIDLKELYRLEDRRREILKKVHSGTYETA